MKYNITVTVSEPSQKAIDAMNAWLKKHIDDDDLLFDIPIENGTVKTMRLSELVAYRKSQDKNNIDTN